MANQISIDLYWKTDRHGNKYLFADPNIPLKVDLSEFVLLIWPHPEEADEYPALAIKKKEPRENPKHEDRDDGHGSGKPWSNKSRG